MSQMRSRRKNEQPAIARLKKDYMNLMKEPVPYITAQPDPRNILEWHYVMKGPEGTVYYGGYYHGVIKFGANFPFSAPSILMLTPNGRFKTSTKLCLSMSNFHQESWSSSWSVRTILLGLLSFMNETQVTYGSIETSDEQKKKLAKESLKFNLNNSYFVELFPEIVDEIKDKLSKMKTDSNEQILNNSVNQESGNNSNLMNIKLMIKNIVINFFLILTFLIIIFSIKYLVY